MSDVVLKPIVVVMGVSGTGKSTLGRAIAERYGFTFLDADDFHPPENVEKMRSGIPLTDADRSPWLDRLSARLADACSTAEPVALACSALKESYRARLREGCPDLLFAFLDGTREVIAKRLGNRTGHYMPAALLDSQFATLERPAPGPQVLVLDCRRAPEDLATEVAERLGSRQRKGRHRT